MTDRNWILPTLENRTVGGLEDPVMIQEVKISPGSMIFRNAYDGKEFCQVLTITNCGRTLKNVRIFQPNSKAFKVNVEPVGVSLAPGLSIVKQIRYLFIKSTAIPQTGMTIYINNQRFNYNLLVNTSTAILQICPKHLDFGMVDLGIISENKKIYIKNVGQKHTQFSIDLGRNQFQIIVNPMKAVVQPGETKELTVEVFGFNPGPFMQEFWIKSEPLRRIHIKGCFIQPTCNLLFPLMDTNMMLLPFPKSFIGIEHYRSVVIQNHSSIPAVYCVMGKTLGKIMPYKAAMEFDDNFHHFQICPCEGRLRQDQPALLDIRYCPQRSQITKDFYMCIAIVRMIKCQSHEHSCKADDSKSNFSDIGKVSSILSDSLSAYCSSDQPVASIEQILPADSTTICLYGEVEVPKVSLEPDKFCMRDLNAFQTYDYTLTILNHSKSLPLVIKYETKIANVKIEPTSVTLPPSEPVNVSVKVQPTHSGPVLSKVYLIVYYQMDNQLLVKLMSIGFDVVFNAEYTNAYVEARRPKSKFLHGITPKISHEVGFLVDDVRYNTSIKKPTTAIVDKLQFNNDALIAFPNDRPKNLRPWRNSTPCKTLFTQQPRLITQLDSKYDLTAEQQMIKYQQNSYYAKYIRSFSKKKFETLKDDYEDYETTNKKLLLMEQFVKGDLTCPTINYKEIISKNFLVPLTPYHILGVVVTPKCIQLGKLASNSGCSDYFTIENDNNFPIHASIRTCLAGLKIKTDQFLLTPYSKNQIHFTFMSSRGGRHHSPLYIVLNFFHVIELTVLATIVANTVKCLDHKVSINPRDKMTYLELVNVLHSDVSFEVDTKFFQLVSFPEQGTIPAQRNMLLTITLDPLVGYIQSKEIAIVSESGYQELIDVTFESVKATVIITSTTIHFGKIPLNAEVTQELFVINKSDQIIPLRIELDDSSPVTVKETFRLISPKADTVINFTITEFNIPVTLVLQNEYDHTVSLTGEVVFPNVMFKPEFMKMPKTISGSLNKFPFKVFNNSEVHNELEFAMADYTDFSVTNKQGANISCEKVILAPREKKDFILEFHPEQTMSYCMYIPFILNGLLGPPDLNSPESIKISHYLDDSSSNNDDSKSKGTLNVLKLLCGASEGWFAINKMNFSFSTLQTTKDEWKIQNVSSNSQEISLQFNPSSSFKLNIPSKECQAIFEDVKLTILLEPNEMVSINIEFLPDEFGTFNEEIAVFVKAYSETEQFNRLQLTGIHASPQIIPNTCSIYFTPSHVLSKETKSILLELYAHKCNKSLEVHCDCYKLEVVFDELVECSNHKSVAKYKITFNSKEDCHVEAEITFLCACSVQSSIEVFACCDISFLINFPGDDTIKNYSTYPLFPEIFDQSPYAKFLGDIVTCLETWLYSQGFFYRSSYKIPDDIARYPVQYEVKDKMGPSQKKKSKDLLPLIQLLVNLVDRSILKYIDCHKEPSSDLYHLSIYKYLTYQKAIFFLKCQGIQVPGLRPEHLLTYTEYSYVKMRESFQSHLNLRENFDEATYYRFTKQKWLDLLFQIYKVSVCERVVDPKLPEQTLVMTEGHEHIIAIHTEYESYVVENCSRFQTCSLCEAKLLLWLEFHCNRQKGLLLPKEEFDGPVRLNDFKDIDDGIALAAVTATYCPYLVPQFNDLFVRPNSIEQKIHNSCLIVQAWKQLKLSFRVHPQSIVRGNNIQIIFLVTYLYDVLPHFYPSKNVVIEATLSASASYNLILKNCGNVPIQYQAIFIGEQSKLFTLDANNVVIPGGKKMGFKLTYSAKRVLDSHVILVLSGENEGQKYAKSLAVSLVGKPQITSPIEIKVSIDTYKFKKQRITLKSPYGKTYKAKLFVCMEQQISYEHLHSVSELKAQNIPRDIDFLNDTCEFEEKGEAVINLISFSLSQGPRHFYLLFCNDEVGDFCCYIKMESKLAKDSVMDILVDAPNVELACTCKNGSISKKCPRAFVVNVPCKNCFLWSNVHLVINNCFLETTVNALEPFFRKCKRNTCHMENLILDSPVIFRLFKFYLEKYSKGFMLNSSIFNDEVNYLVSPNSNYTYPTIILNMKDVTDSGTVPLYLHWSQSSFNITQEILELRSVDEKEIRKYNLMFSSEVTSVTNNHSNQSIKT